MFYSELHEYVLNLKTILFNPTHIHLIDPSSKINTRLVCSELPSKAFASNKRVTDYKFEIISYEIFTHNQTLIVFMIILLSTYSLLVISYSLFKNVDVGELKSLFRPLLYYLIYRIGKIMDRN